MKVSPTAQLYVEGEAIFEHCIIEGNADVLITVNGGYLKGVNSNFRKAKEVGIALLNNSNGVFINCKFHHNGKMRLFAKTQKLFRIM